MSLTVLRGVRGSCQQLQRQRSLDMSTQRYSVTPYLIALVLLALRDV